MSRKRPRQHRETRAPEPQEKGPPRESQLPPINRWLVVAAIAAVVLAYLPAFSAPFVLDDHVTIPDAAHWEAPEGSPAAGRPLVLATLAANFAINQALGVNQDPDPDGPHKAIGYRLFNLAIHLATAALLFGFLRRLLREPRIPGDWGRIADPLAGTITVLWLLHPIQSEVINYISQRTEALASLGYVATLYACQRAWSSAPARRFSWYGIAVFAAVLGMLSKEVAITVPLTVMLYDRAFRLDSWRAVLRSPERREILYAMLWVSCIAVFGFVGLGARGDSAGTDAGLAWYRYLYSQCWSIAHYLRLAVWPHTLVIDYGYAQVRGLAGVPGLALLIAAGIATLFAWRHLDRFAGLAFAGSAFFVLLAPSSSVVPVVLEVAAERRIYLALAAFIAVVVVGFEVMRRRIAPRVSPRWISAAVAAIALGLAVTTAFHSATYQNQVTLFRDAAEELPDDASALGDLGWALYTSRPPEMAAAESVFVKAMAIDTICHARCQQYASLLTRQNRFAEAIPLLQRTLAQEPYNLNASRLLALDLMRTGDYKDAIPYLERVTRRSRELDRYVVLGVAYLSVGRASEAAATFRFMATLEPTNDKLQHLAKRLEDGTQIPEALANLQDFAFGMTRNWM